jgi:DNA-binding NarL/FixJ family response regulator
MQPYFSPRQDAASTGSISPGSSNWSKKCLTMADTAVRDIVLVVDDSPETLSVLIEAIESAGMTALVARDGTAALSLIDRVLPDVILLDAVMPGIDGFETCRRLKSMVALTAIPVIFMTGLSDSAHVLEGLRAGGVDYLTKPINPDELVARIAIHVANARMVEDARSALDATGQSVFAIRPDRTIAWASSGATRILAPMLDERPIDAICAHPSVIGWIEAVSTRALSQSPDLDLSEDGGQHVRLAVIGRSAGGDLLIRATEVRSRKPEEMLSRELGLTAREGDVLYWLCQGKSNRDIAQILNLSPRTVMKHIEQIFVKMQVENRTAAASVGLRLLVRS